MTATAHTHDFLGEDHDRNEKRVWLVIFITAAMMVVEIVAGYAYGSMALIADGFHMSTHALAMLVAVGAYIYARRHRQDARFSFGTGKVGDLAGFASALMLGGFALFIAYESTVRLFNPVPISFGQAMLVAAIGLAVNLVCAFLLREDHTHHGHHHGHDHHHHEHSDDDRAHDHGPRHGARDNNLRAAYLHVLADALTSLLAIAALGLGAIWGWVWLDAVMGIVGAIIIGRWSFSLIRHSSAVLLDMVPDETLRNQVSSTVARLGGELTDLHIWQVGPGHNAAIVSVSSSEGKTVDDFKAALSGLAGLSHLTVELRVSAS
ncbi:CDF family Co(II)/Ni(II) efflux transporter DmeF [Limoniibacter endophyticus]|uniref:Cation transporter n=1 Tax=Limoniibacter endophyticus TaxID=1565040 RepID=A0A8J3DSE7_9HYPH|nr:CDF family Co(II)/Ni(II) efflux transporter DmeF [Limoniibacter endophyticus]GHC77653.1 cation transporter [Limoniibacter endophyticus]